VAKLAACRHAVLAGVDRVAIVDGGAAGGFAGAPGTRIVSRANDVVRRLGAGFESGELRV